LKGRRVEEAQAPDLDLGRLYRARFAGVDVARDALWKVLCRHFFQHYVRPDDTVVEVAAGHCEFINNIVASHRVAVDLNPELPEWADPQVRAIVGSSVDLAGVEDQSADVVFVSNFFEHITRPDILATLSEVRRALRPGGTLLVLQPNIRFCGYRYWSFFDHITPLDDQSLTEALEASGFAVIRTIVRFLPYTTKGRLPSSPKLARLYLRIPLLWRIFGGQTFVVARPAGIDGTDLGLFTSHAEAEAEAEPG
jgi:ubiquinone/menaquinone biosynthesis C-methylase UbiE